MNKLELINNLKQIVKQNLQTAYEAAQNTYDIATHEENKAENKYDTRGLEASYLAGAQAERVKDIKDTLASYESLTIKIFENDSKIALTALVEIGLAEKNIFVLLMPKGGGQTIIFDKQQIQVITPDSPLGMNLVGKQVGDVFELKSGNKSKEYEILSVQ